MANNNRNLIMKRISKPPAWQCPSCGGDPTGLTWEDGETIGLAAAPENCDAAMMWGTCPACGEELYLLEVGIMSGRAGGQFIMDHCWKAERTHLYSMRSRAIPEPWLLYEHRKLSGVSVLDAQNGMRELAVPLLDIHTFEGWTATDRHHAWHKAQEMAHRLVALFTTCSADH